MADVKTLKEKVTKATEKVEKCKATIERHKKALENKLQKLTKKGFDVSDIKGLLNSLRGTGNESIWEIYDAERKMDDIKGATKKLKEAEDIRDGWVAKLKLEVEKDRFISLNAPQVIVDFLEAWKEKAYEWHIRRYNDYLALKKELSEKEKKARAEIGIKESVYANNAQREELKKRGLDYGSTKEKLINFAGGTVLRMAEMYKESERFAWLEKTLEQEKRMKLQDLIFRIQDVVGKITDAKGLSINQKGNLDGLVIGSEGKAKVETIGAGGWNIQVFHYRTLVNKIR